MKKINRKPKFTPVKTENGEAATAPTVTASEPGSESRENLPEEAAEPETVLALVKQVAKAEPLKKQHEEAQTQPSPPAVTPMTMEEIEQREELVNLVRKSLDGVREGVGALLKIRERELWRGTHDTFGAFCRDVFDISEPRASQLISHAIQCSQLKEAKFADDQIPTSERAIRELRRVKAADRMKVFEKALELAGGVRPKTAHVLEARVVIEGIKEVGMKEPKLQVITPEEAVSAAETLKQFLEKCETDNLTMRVAKQITELTKGIADVAASRLLVA